jgi:tryptophanyl-tRNA synthetase
MSAPNLDEATIKSLKDQLEQQAKVVRDLKSSGKANEDPQVAAEVAKLLAIKQQLDPNAKVGKQQPQSQQQAKKGGAAAVASTDSTTTNAAVPSSSSPDAAPSSSGGDQQQAGVDGQQKVTPWTATSVGGFDYDKLIRQFGSAPIDAALVKRFEAVTKTRAHRFLRRGLFFSQKDLSACLDAYEKGEEIYLYTGRGPTSSSMHIGHMVPFEFTKYLQDAFDAILVVQMADDEKYYFKDPVKDLEYYQDLGRQNAKDIIARGFRLDKTYIFSNPEEVGGAFFKNAVRMMRATTGNQIKGIFGLCTEENNVGEICWPIFQSVPAYSSSFPNIFSGPAYAKGVRCLVPMAIDQDPYFRLARDFVETGPGRGLIKPAAIHSEFLVGLGGIDDKMSSSVADAAMKSIFLTDAPEVAAEKIKKYAFSGGGKTLKEHQEHGAHLEIDVPYQYLLYFLEDDEELRRIATEYASGRMATSEIKQKMVDVVTAFLLEHQARRAQVTDEVVEQFYTRIREFNHGRAPRDGFELQPNEFYTKLGYGFDRYFGQGKGKPTPQ